MPPLPPSGKKRSLDPLILHHWTLGFNVISDVTVLYGSQTGNAARLAAELTRRLRRMGFSAALNSMSDFPPDRIAEAKNLLLVVSTHGEGQPPDKAVGLHEFLHGAGAPRLDGLRFAVLALGDVGYAKFCAAGRQFDHRLAELGAERLFPRADCDVDYTEPAEAWMQGVAAALRRVTEAAGESLGLAPSGGPAAEAAPDGYSQARPFPAELVERILLNGRGSDKATWHLEFSLEGSGLEYTPGDALGICPENDPRLVDELLRAMRWPDDAPVPAGRQQRPLWEALLRYYEITRLTRPLLEQAVRFGAAGLADLLRSDRQAQLDAYLAGRDLLDLVQEFRLSGVPPTEFVPILRRIPPRLYSIAGSARVCPNRVAVTMAAVRYRARGRSRSGVCSAHCAERVALGDRVPVYVSGNPNFRLPSDPAAPIVMIGPGTGVAPFRAFLQEREATGATGRNWLFFGDRRFRTDFLYQTEWQDWLRKGILARLDVAFSRDAAQKTYVQHRMTERRRELFAWLAEGATIYVCGDAQRMAPNVHAALEAAVAAEGRMTDRAARDFVAELLRQGRYQRDVY